MAASPPAPGQLRADGSPPWQPVRAFAAGKERDFKLDTLGNLRWRPAGSAANLLYPRRREAGVDFREERTVPGIGRAQVRHAAPARLAPAPGVISRSMLPLAGSRRTPEDQSALPPGKRHARAVRQRTSTRQLVNVLRGEVRGRGLGAENFPGLSSILPADMKPEKFPLEPAPAVLNCRN
jgi:hypothetical protein